MLDALSYSEDSDNENDIVPLSSSQIYQRAWKVMQTRSQVMDKSSIIAILRTQAHLSYIQAHTAFYLLIKGGLF